MAERKPKELTPVMRAAKTAQAALKAAKEKAVKQDNDMNKKAVEHAKAKVAETKAVAAKERWFTVGGGRVLKTITAIDNLANAANPKSYSYTPAHVEKMFKDIDAAISDCRLRFENSLKITTGEKKTAAQAYSFE